MKPMPSDTAEMGVYIVTGVMPPITYSAARNPTEAGRWAQPAFGGPANPSSIVDEDPSPLRNASFAEDVTAFVLV